MYCKHFGLDKNPFDLTPAGGLLYLSETHREALAVLRYGILADQGFLLLTGGVGTGKTSILNTLLRLLKDSVQVHVLNNPALSRNEMYHYLSGVLGFNSRHNKGAFLLEFTKLLQALQSDGKKLLLIIDEAQAFSVGLLEEIRLLSNHAGEQNVLSIFMIGQPELQEVLANPKLLPLRQRIGVLYHLESLNREDTEQYIVYRLNKAGASNPAIFDSQAVDAIHLASKGTPRLINVICDNALILGYSLDARRITRQMVERAIGEMKLPGEQELQISKPVVIANEENRPKQRVLWLALFTVSALVALGVASGLLYLWYLQGRLPAQLNIYIDKLINLIDMIIDFKK